MPTEILQSRGAGPYEIHKEDSILEAFCAHRLAVSSPTFAWLDAMADLRISPVIVDQVRVIESMLGTEGHPCARNSFYF